MDGLEPSCPSNTPLNCVNAPCAWSAADPRRLRLHQRGGQGRRGETGCGRGKSAHLVDTGNLFVRLPLTAGVPFLDSDFILGPMEELLSPPVGLVVLMVWTAAALTAGALVLQRRDA